MSKSPLQLTLSHFPLLIFLIALAGCQRTAETTLPRKTISPELATQFDSVFLAVNAVSTSDLHSLMVAQHDTILYEKYAVGHSADELHIQWSATKTFTAAAVGFAVQEGLLDLHTPLVNYLNADDLASLEGADSAIYRLTLDHCLKMSSGLPASDFTDRIRGGEDVDVLKEIAEVSFTHEPGTHWRYNNLDTYLCSLCLTRVSGVTLEEYMRTHIFEPLGIREWLFEIDRRGINPGAWGLHLSTESMMRFGLFMLHKGNWQGQQLLNEEWFDVACTPQIQQLAEPTESDWHCGYCYQCWACHVPGSYRADGMWGQYIVVVPSKDLVGVMTTLCTDRKAQMDGFWKYVYMNM